MKTSHRKSQPKIIHYCKYRNFRNDVLGSHSRKSSHSKKSCDKGVDEFLISSNKILDQYAPRKKMYVRGNHSFFMSKNLSIAILLRTKMNNILLKNRTEENKG